MAYFSSETMKANRGITSLKCGEREDCQPRILHLKKYIFENRWKNILHKQKLRKSKPGDTH